MPSQRKATSITPVSLLKHQKWGNKVLKFLIFLYMHYGFRLWVEKNEKIKGSKRKACTLGKRQEGPATRHLPREGNAYKYRLPSQEKRQSVLGTGQSSKWSGQRKAWIWKIGF